MAFSRLSKLTTGALLTAYYPMTIFLVVSIPCFALLLAGCSSHHASLPSIYLISLSYPNLTSNNASGINKDLSSLFAPLVGNAQLTVRTGYYGLCLGLENKDWMCSNDAAGLKDHVNATQDPLNLIAMSMLFKDHIVVPGLLYGDFGADLKAGNSRKSEHFGLTAWQIHLSRPGPFIRLRLGSVLSSAV